MGGFGQNRVLTRVLCIGGASCVWDDMDALRRIYGQPWDCLVVVANDIGTLYPYRVDHWVTCHSDKLVGWAEERRLNGFSDGYKTWGTGKGTVGERLEPYSRTGSGGLAVRVALEKLEADRVVLVGIPLTKTPHFYGGEDWEGADSHWAAWQREYDKNRAMRHFVRSMSGRTRDLFGQPTRGWLYGE